MHELSIALSIVDGVLEELRLRGLAHAEAVHLRLGRLSGVDQQALAFSYEIACQETPLAGSRLVIQDSEVLILCPACGAGRPAQSFPMLTCAQCGTAASRVLQGEELEITGMEVSA